MTEIHHIEGNEQADKEAKAAAEGKTSPARELPKTLKKPRTLNKSAAKQHFKSALKNIWSKEWSDSPRADKAKCIDPTLPSNKFLKLISETDLSRKGASWLFQMRVGHFPLNAYLFRFKRTDSASCPACGHHTKSIQHFLLDCPAYAHKRWALTKKRRPKDRDFAKLLANPETAVPITKFIQDTGRFTEEISGWGSERRNAKDISKKT